MGKLIFAKVKINGVAIKKYNNSNPLFVDMKIVNLPNILLLLIFILGCRSKGEIGDYRDEAIVISPTQTINRLDDSIYLSDQIGQISTNQNIILIPETNFAKYYFIDSNLNYLFEFGSSGKGPGEFIANYRGFIRDSMVYLPDIVNGKIESYRIGENNLILENESENKFHIGEYGAIVNKEHHIITSSYLTSNPFLVYDPLNGAIIDSFGSFIEFDNFNQKRANNCYLMGLDPVNEDVVTVNIQIPLIRIYTQKNGNTYTLSREYEYKYEFSRYYNYLDTYFGGSLGHNGVMLSFVEDIAINNRLLYLLVWDEYFNVRNPCILIEIDYMNDFEILRVFKLLNNYEHSAFSSICFVGNKLICFEKYSSSLLCYDIY